MPEQNSIQLRITHNSTFVNGRLDKQVYQSLRKAIGYTPETARWMQFKHPKWDGHISCVCYSRKYCKCFIKKDGTHFPTGLLWKAREIFDNFNISYSIVDSRSTVKKTISFSMSDTFELRDYQQKVVDIAVKKERGIIRMATGSGKTACSAHIIAKLGVSPFIFYVPSKDLLYQAKNEFESFLRQNGLPIEVGIIGGGHKNIKPISVMTIQTAVRVLGTKYKKVDEEDQDDDTDIDDIKQDIRDLIRSSKGIICDEVQHWAADTCQIIADASEECRYRYGISATPWRDMNDDILIDACFGKIIADINASFLIDRGFLVPPEIFFIPVGNMRGIKLTSYPEVYQTAIAENDLRNYWIANLAQVMKQNGKTVLVLCRLINHGNLLESLIPGSVFLHGSVSGKKRQEHLQLMREKKAPVTIATSLPFCEVIPVRIKGFVRLIQIGHLVENLHTIVSEGYVEALCSLDGKSAIWQKITGLHKHKRMNTVKRVLTDYNEEVLVTENHSLVDYNKDQVKPTVGGLASCPVFNESISSSTLIDSIDLVDLLSSLDDRSIEVELLGLTQPIMRKLRTWNKYWTGNHVCKNSRLAADRYIKDKGNDYKIAIKQLIDHFSYEKGKMRAKLVDLKNCKTIFDFFEARIFIRRSRKGFFLPIRLPVTRDLAILSGLMCSEGHINEASCKTCRSRFDWIFTGLLHNVDSSEGKHDIDKKNIRQIFKSAFYGSIGNFHLIENDKQIKFNSKLMYLLFQSMGHINLDREKRVPDYVFNSSREIQEAYLWGVYLGDGSKRLDYRPGKKKSDIFSALIISSSSREMVSGIVMLLKMMGKKYYITYQHAHGRTKKRYQICIGDSIDKLHPTRLLDKIGSSTFERIQSVVEDTDILDDYVYDITVENSHNFVAGVGCVLCHNSIFDEGIDCKPLDTLILAGSGKSATRALQRIGRCLRPYPGKQSATIIDFEDRCKFMLKHSNRRKKIYQTEPRFAIKYMEIDQPK